MLGSDHGFLFGSGSDKRTSCQVVCFSKQSSRSLMDGSQSGLIKQVGNVQKVRHFDVTAKIWILK